MSRVPDERGSLAVALVVLLALTSLSLGLLARSLGALGTARRVESGAEALSAADAALAVVRHRLGAEPGLTDIEGSSSVGGATFAYAGEPQPDGTWAVTADGSANGVRRRVRATLLGRPRYEHAVFTAETLVVPTGVTGAVGSNGDVLATGSGHSGGTQQFVGACTGCTDPEPLAEPRPMAPLDLPASAVPSACTFTGVVPGGGGTPRLCAGDAVFSGTVTVEDGPLVVHVPDGSSARLDGARVKAPDPVLGGDPSPADVRIVLAGGGEVTLAGTVAHAVLDAPRATVRVGPGTSSVRGAILAGDLRVDPTAAFTLVHDERVRAAATGWWRVVGYREVAVD